MVSACSPHARQVSSGEMEGKRTQRLGARNHPPPTVQYSAAACMTLADSGDAEQEWTQPRTVRVLVRVFVPAPTRAGQYGTRTSTVTRTSEGSQSVMIRV